MIPMPLILYYVIGRMPWFRNAFDQENRKILAGRWFVFVPLICYVDLFCRSLVCVGLAAGVFFLLLTMKVIELPRQEVVVEESNEGMLRRIWNLDAADFNKALNDASVEQLIDNWGQFELQTGDDFVLRIQRLTSGLSFAEKIIEAGESEQIAFGMAKRLMLRSELWLSNHKLNQATQEIYESLRNELIQCRLFLQEQPSELLNSAIQMAQLVIWTHEKLVNDSAATPDLDYAQFDPNDRRLANIALEMVAIAESQSPEKSVARQLLARFAETDDLYVHQLVVDHREKYLQDLVAIDVQALSPTEIPNASQQIHQSLEAVFSSTEDIQGNAFEKVVRFVSDLNSLGSHDLVANLDGKLSPMRSTNIDLTNELKRQAQRAKSAGKVVNGINLFDSSGRAVKFQSASKHVLLFASTNRIQASSARLMAILKNLNKVFDSEETKLSIVFVHGENATSEINDFSKFVGRQKNLNAFYLPTASETFRQVRQSFMVDRIPYVLYLENGEIVLNDPLLSALEHFVFRS